MTKRWSPTLAERRRLRALYVAGCSDAQIGADIGRTAGQVAYVRRAHGLIRDRDALPRKPPPAWYDVARALFRRHRSDAEIAAEVGRAVRTVAAFRRSLGFKLPGRRPSPAATIAAAKARTARRKVIPERDLVVMAAAKRQGHSFESIGRLWRIDARRVRRELGGYLKEHPQPAHAGQHQDASRAA